MQHQQITCELPVIYHVELLLFWIGRTKMYPMLLTIPFRIVSRQPEIPLHSASVTISFNLSIKFNQ